MTKLSFKTTIVVSAAITLAASVSVSCNKEYGKEESCELSLKLSCANPATKAVLYGSSDDLATKLDAIGVYGFDGSTVLINGEKAMPYTGEGWKTTSKHNFTLKELKYAAYYPYNASSMNITSASSTGMTFDYTVPADASLQNDVMVAYNNTAFLWRVDGVSLTFAHALSGVKIMCGEMQDDVEFVSLKIKGVYAEQTCTASFGASGVSFAWTSTASSRDVTMTPAILTPSNGSEMGTFALIPQNFGSSQPVLELSLKNGETVVCKFPVGTNWETGKLYTYSLILTDLAAEGTLSPWESGVSSTGQYVEPGIYW